MTDPIEAEMSLLGSILLSAECISDIAPIVAQDEFVRRAHSTIFSAMMRINERGDDLDIVTLQQELASRGELERVGGITYLMAISEYVPTIHHAQSYARIVHREHVRRSIITTAQIAINQLNEGENPVEEVGDWLSAEIDNLATRSVSSMHVGEMAEEEVASITARKSSNPSGFRSGLLNVDRITNGFRRQELSIIGARPSMGKSAFALQVAHNMSRSGVCTLYASIEMSQSMVAQRILSMATRIDGVRLSNDVMDMDDIELLNKAKRYLREIPMHVSAHSPCDMALLRSLATRLKRSGDLQVLVVDYLQMIDGKSDNRVREIGLISRGLKSLAKELDIAVIALSSLSRRVESRDDKRPLMSDLRESGDIESDADLVTFLYRPLYYAEPSMREGLTEEPCEFIVSKNRNGRTGTANLTFHPFRASFDDAADMGAF